LSDIEIRGVEDMLRLSKALKNAGRLDTRRELHKGIQKAARPLIPAARAAALTTLPQRGGLAGKVARAPMRVQVRTGRDPGVRIVVGKDRSGARAANHGLIRHPVFGHRDRWVDQRVPADWFDGAMRRNAPAVRPEIARAMDRVVDKIVRGAR